MSRLSMVSKGKKAGPRKFCFYGPEGVGKTTLATRAPSPIIFDLEKGSSELDVTRYVFDDTGSTSPETLTDFISGVDDLIENEHDFKTLIIDSLDWLEELVWKHCIKRDNKKDIEAYGFHKGYGVSLDELRKLLKKFEILQSRRGMHVILIGHTHVKAFHNPSDEDYDRYWLNTHKDFAGKIKQWVDVLGFCCFEGGGGSIDKGSRAKGWSTGRRLLKLEFDAAFDAKSRIPMPKEVELDIDDPWGPFAEALRIGSIEDRGEILSLIGIELERLGDEELNTKVRQACKKAKETIQLSRFLMNLKNRTPETSQKDEE